MTEGLPKCITFDDMRQSLSKKGESPITPVRLPKEMKAAAKARAKQERRSFSEVVRLALEDYLAKPVKVKPK